MDDQHKITGAITAAEGRFDRLRRSAGFVLAPTMFVILLLLPLSSLRPEAHRLAAVMAAVIILWVTEALPLPVTALLGAATCVALRVAPAKDVTYLTNKGPGKLAEPLVVRKLCELRVATGLDYPQAGRHGLVRTWPPGFGYWCNHQKHERPAPRL